MTLTNPGEKDCSELDDLLQSMQNVISTSLFLLRCGKVEWLPTQLEYLHELSQRIIDDWCVVGEI